MFLPLLLALMLYDDVHGALDPSLCILPPQRCPNENITFWLYTRDTEDNPYQILNDEASIMNAPFIANAPTIVIIHGYTGNKDFDPNPQIRPAYLRRFDCNVISIDYGPLAPEPCYITAVQNVPLVGQCGAEMIETLVGRRKIPLESFHVIGFSLGAQVAGEIGKRMTIGQFERITGLDPAMPLFVTVDRNRKLEKSDAKFVDVIHTDALDKGKLEALGHVDFYANGGMRQPGCENLDKSAEGSCNHVRAPEYYGESINSDLGFYGHKCDSWFLYMMSWCKYDNGTEEVIMGAYTPSDTRGLYFVDTNSEPPYAKGNWESQHDGGVKDLNASAAEDAGNKYKSSDSESQVMLDLEHHREKIP